MTGRQVGGVNIPGQWLTRGYVRRHQEANVRVLREPPIHMCPECDALFLGAKHRNCPYEKVEVEDGCLQVC